MAALFICYMYMGFFIPREYEEDQEIAEMMEAQGKYKNKRIPSENIEVLSITTYVVFTLLIFSSFDFPFFM